MLCPAGRKSKTHFGATLTFWSHTKLLRINTNSMCLNFILAGKPAASTTLKRDKLDME